MTVKRKLPARFNNLLSEPNPKKDELAESRRLGQTRLMSSKGSPTPASASPQMTLFSYVHLRAPLPHDINPEIFGNGTKPEAYFLMRRSKDGYVSSTGMFKASFPWATKVEEDAERKYVKSHFDASAEETAGNLWVHPDDALTLSSDYHCRVWIEALVDERQVHADNRNKAVTPPPPYRPTSSSADVTPIASLSPKVRGRTRSKSPVRKIAQPRKSRLAKAGSTDTSKTTPSQTAQEKDTPATPASDLAVPSSDSRPVTPKDAPQSKSIKAEEDSVPDAAPVAASGATVEVTATKETKDGVETESVKVKVELPLESSETLVTESPEEMIAKAKEMVAEALKVDGSLDATSGKNKRKVEESTDAGAGDVPNIEGLEITSSPQSKRTKVFNAIKEERFQKRALLGIGATVAIGGLAFFSNLI